MALNFDITGDNTNFLRKLEEAKRGVDDTSRYIEREGGNIEAIFGKIGRSAAAIGLGLSAKEIVSNVATIRGQFQQLEVAFKTMLGGERESDSLMRQLVKTAATTPFDLQSVANGAKQLLAYGENVENVNDDLIRLGNIASGLSQPLGDLVYLYGTTMTQGRLYTQDFNQFTGRGIPMVKELAKQFNVAESEVKGLVEAGRVGFPEVQKVIQSLTNEGGKFYNLMEEQSKTITGQISNIGDSFDMMFNNIGKQSEGIINTALSGTSYVLENYEKIGKTLIELAATYGAYKAVLIAVTAMQRIHTVVMEQAIVEKQLAAMANITLSQSEAVAAARTKLFTVALKDNTKALLSNPYAIAAAAVAALGYGIYKLYTYQTDAEKAQSKLNDAVKEMNRASLSEQRELAKLKGELSALTKGSNEYNIVKDKIVKGYGKYYDGLESEIEKVGLTEQAYRKLTEAITQSFGARQYEKFKNEQTEELDSVMSDNLEKLQKRLIDRLGDESGSYFYTKIREGLINGSLKIGKGLSVLGLDKSTQAALNIASGEASKDAVRNKAAEGYIRSIISAQELMDRMDKEAKVRFGIDDAKKDNVDSNGVAAPTTTYQQDVAAAKAAWDKAKKAYAEIIKDEKATAESVKNARLEVSTAEQKYKNLTGSDLGKQDNKASELKKEQQAYVDLLSKQSIEERRANENLYNETVEARINAMDEGSAKVIAQMEYNFEKEMQAIDRAKEDELQKKIEDARSAFEANPENKGKSFDATGIELSNSEQKYFDELYKSAIAVNEKTKLRSEADAMRDYLKEYGTFQQHKLAIAEEYADKIKKATTKGERLSLEKQRDSAIQQVDIKALEQKIDWQAVFGDISGILGSQLKETLEGLKEYVKTDKFNSSSETDKQIVYDAIDRLNEVTPGGEGTLNFSKIKAQMDNLGASISKYQAATIAQTLAQDNLKKATDNYNNALKDGSSEQIENAKTGLSMAQNAAKIADDAYNSAASDVRNLGEEYKSTSADTIDGLNLVAAGFQGFANKSLPSIFSGLQNTLTGLSKLNIGGAVGDAIGKLSQTLSSAGVIGQIISAILSILDILKDGIGPLISGIIDSIFGAINGILDNILSGDMFVQIFSSIKNGIGNILNTISFGGFNSLFGIGGNKKEVEEAINRLTDRNETLQTAIEDLTDVMEASKGTKSVAAYTDAKKLQKETEDNYKKIAQEQARYSSAHHSWNYYWGGFNQEETSRLSNQIGRNWNGDIWSLSPEEMKMLRSNVDMWEKIQNAGKGGYGERLTEKLDDYIDQAGKMEELTDKLYEGLTGISFDSMYDSFIDTLMDMDASAEDSANKISEYFMRAMLSNKIGELYSDKLEEWWKKFGASMEDNELTEAEREALQDEYMQYVDEATKIRDELAAATGYDKISQGSTSQSSSSKGFQAMSQDSADELSGRFAALQISGEETKNAMLSLLIVVNSMSVVISENNIIMSEIRNLMVSSNSYLEDIAGYNKKMYNEFGTRLENMETYLKSLS